jgi:hypothetical protein
VTLVGVFLCYGSITMMLQGAIKALQRCHDGAIMVSRVSYEGVIDMSPVACEVLWRCYRDVTCIL